jgi:uncharacterized phosphosugar-binding protein
MSIIDRYYEAVRANLDTVMELEREKIETAAQWVSEKVLADDIFYVFGTGAHSVIPAIELFIRAGGLCNASGLFPPGITDFDRHPKTEKVSGLAGMVLDHHGVESDDLLLICNVNGINAMTIDAALEARRRGARTVGITSVDFSTNAESGIAQRHTSNQNLYELVDLYIDAHVPVGDALLDVPGVPVPVGPGSTYPMVLIANSIVVRAIEIVAEAGGNPPVLKSFNMKGGQEYGQPLIEKYRNRIRHFG